MHLDLINRRRITALAATVLASVSLGGCGMFTWLGGETDPNPPTELTDFSQEVSLQTLWSKQPTDGGDGRRLALVPAVSAGRVYVAGIDGELAALASDSGRILWQRDAGLPFSAGPDVEGERLVIGTADGQVVALSTSDGRELWRARVGSEVLSVPRATGEGKIIVHTLDDTIQALDAANGALLWQVTYSAPVLTLRGSGTPVITPSGVVVGLAGGKLVKLDPADGLPLWDITITAPRGRSELARITDIDADPVVVGNLIFVGTYNGDLAAVDLMSGGVLWRRQLSSYAGLSASETNLFITDSDDQVWGADPVGGGGRWRQERLLHRGLTAPAVIGSYIAVGDIEGYVHLLAQSDGRLVARTRVAKSPIDVRPVSEGGRLYVSARDGTIAVLTVAGAVARSTGGDGKSAVPATEADSTDMSAEQAPL